MEDGDEIKTGKKLFIWTIIVMFVVSGFIFFLNRTVTTVDNGIIHYEEFTELYHTCQKLNSDLCNMRDLPDTDKMFEQFSKPQRINTMKGQLNRWIEDYNGKSKMFNRSIWKSSSLPYQLTSDQFNCYSK